MNARNKRELPLTLAVLAAVRGKSDTQQRGSAKGEMERVPETRLARLFLEEEL